MRMIDGLGVTRGGGTAEGAAPNRRVNPHRVMAKGIISSKLAGLDDKASLVRTADICSFPDHGARMRQRTFEGFAVAFILGLLMALVWSLIQVYGF
jgi:hypothetical protein